MARRIPWLRVFVEGTVIVVSILLAFGIDAWWQRQQDAERALEYVRALRADMQAAVLQLDSAIAASVGQQAATNRVLELVRDTGPVADSSVSGEIDIGGEAMIPMGTLTALVETGDVGLLEDERLRATIVKEYSLIQRIVLILDRFFEMAIDNNRDRILVIEGLRASPRNSHTALDHVRREVLRRGAPG